MTSMNIKSTISHYTVYCHECKRFLPIRANYAYLIAVHIHENPTHTATVKIIYNVEKQK